jgi:lambda repressor-like predicted transcriptional regulator
MITKVFSDKHTIAQVRDTKLEKVLSWPEMQHILARAMGVQHNEIIGLEVDSEHVAIKYSPKTQP